MYSIEKLNTILREYGGFLRGIKQIFLVVDNEEETLDCVFSDKKWVAQFDKDGHILAKGYTGNEDFYAKKGKPSRHGSEIAIVVFADSTIFRFPCYELMEGEKYPECFEDTLYRLEAERVYGKERFAAMLEKAKTDFGIMRNGTTLVNSRTVKKGEAKDGA